MRLNICHPEFPHTHICHVSNEALSMTSQIYHFESCCQSKRGINWLRCVFISYYRFNPLYFIIHELWIKRLAQHSVCDFAYKDSICERGKKRLDEEKSIYLQCEVRAINLIFQLRGFQMLIEMQTEVKWKRNLFIPESWFWLIVQKIQRQFRLLLKALAKSFVKNHSPSEISF